VQYFGHFGVYIFAMTVGGRGYYELFYTDTMSAIGYAFEFQLSFITSFQDLCPDIDFQKVISSKFIWSYPQENLIYI
jgi:hypothetical protein